MKRRKVSRRGFLKTAIAGAAAASAAGTVAGSVAAQAEQPKAPPKYSDYLKDQDKGNETEAPTESNIEGPFYRPGAPFRTKLYEGEEKGDKLLITGTVVARNGRPVPGAVLEVWHTNAFGRYDNDDPDNPPANDQFHLRARIKADEKGKYQFETVRPGHYPITPTQFRTAHVHLKVHAEGYQSLTTQFFFKGEKYNKTDSWFKPSMVLDLKADGDRFVASFKIVLTRA